MTAAAFQATYADFKLIRTRSAIQVIFEIPLERADDALAALGGMPDPSKERWFGIARLTQPKEEPKQITQTAPLQVRPEADKPPGRTRLARQAGIICNEPAFWLFLKEQGTYAPESADDAAQAVREICNVKSRADLDRYTTAGDTFASLHSAYKAWFRYPVPA